MNGSTFARHKATARSRVFTTTAATLARPVAEQFHMSQFNELIDRYVGGPKQLRAAVAGMNREQLMARPVPGKWSTLEVVCHLADFEPILADRMKRIIALERPLLMGADENLLAERLAYHDRDLEEELTLIETIRRSMARILRTLPAD